jgi:ML domain
MVFKQKSISFTIKMQLIKTITLIALLGSVMCGNWPVKTCDGASTEYLLVNSIDLSDAPPVRGKPCSLTISGICNKVFNALDYKLDVIIRGRKLATLKIKTASACSSAQTVYSQVASINLPSIVPAGDYTLKLSPENDKELYGCFEIDVTF